MASTRSGARRDVEAADLSEILDHLGPVGRIGIDAGSDGRAAHVHLQEQGGVLLQPLNLLLQGGGPGGEGLAQRHGDGVLELGAAHLQDMGELFGLVAEGHGQIGQGLSPAP